MKKLFLLLFPDIGMSVNARVAVNTVGSTPDNSAILDVKSNLRRSIDPLDVANKAQCHLQPCYRAEDFSDHFFFVEEMPQKMMMFPKACVMLHL